MTHIMREVDRPGAKLHKKEVVEAVTVIETPPMIGIGLVGYVATPKGLRTLKTIWADHLSNEARRRFYKSWFKSKRKAFTKHMASLAKKPADYKAARDRAIKLMAKVCTVIRLIAHTQIHKLNIGQKKAHLAEVQINGGSVQDKLDFGLKLFEQPIKVADVFAQNEMVDVIGVTKGKGFEGVTTRWGTRRLPRKTHRGLRKVACIGSWHPANIRYTVARAGQNGYYHRTEVNKKVYRVGTSTFKDGKRELFNAITEHDLTKKSITPMGGFPHYGIVDEDYLMIKGSCVGTRKRPITLRKSLRKQTKRVALEQIDLRFIDTSSKIGHGRHQTSDEKAKFMGTGKPE